MPDEPGSNGADLKGTALELFGGLAPSYERALDLTTLAQDRYWKAWIARESRAGGSDLILDVGCGTLLLEERLLGSGGRVVGIDLAEPMLRIGAAKRLPNVSAVINGDAEKLPFGDGSFDAVLSCYVPKYVDLERFCFEVARVTRAGGRVVVYDFVRPRGPFFVFLALYVYGAMRVAGWLLDLAGSAEAFTFKNLPRIVGGAVWDTQISSTFARHGVRTESLRRLSGGVVAGYVGAKGG